MRNLILVLTLLVSTAASCNPAIDAFQQKQYEEASRLFEQQADSAQKYFYLGRIAFMQGDLDRAEDLLKLAVKQNSSDADYQYWFGVVNLRQAAGASIFSAPGYASDAKSALNKALELNPKHVGAMQSLIGFYSHAPSIAGGSMEKAAHLIQQLALVDPLASDLAQLELFQLEENSDAQLLLADKIVKTYPNQAAALFRAGLIFQTAKQYPRAIEIFEQAAAINSDSDASTMYSALYQVGRTAVISDEFTEKGIAALERYRLSDIGAEPGMPNKNWAGFRLASLYWRQGESQKARSLAELAAADSQDEQLRDQAKSWLKKHR